VYPDIEGVCSGAILSSYQRVRVETVCARLSLVSIAPLWMQDQNMLLGDMVASGLTSILVKTAAVGLDRQDLGKSLSKVYPKLLKLNKLYDLHLCGEGGEYETVRFC
jgi:diphthine-ammonia ligase